jgi:mRNA-degrading endonuclease RelE of RelBE toxin-antitoxin system
MSMAQVTITPDAKAQLDAMPIPIRVRVFEIVDRLSRWPDVSGAKPLRGGLAGKFRIRTGDYRVRFRVEGENVIVERIGHRSKFYED